jgi:hypothetical protein
MLPVPRLVGVDDRSRIKQDAAPIASSTLHQDWGMLFPKKSLVIPQIQSRTGLFASKAKHSIASWKTKTTNINDRAIEF